MGQWISGGQKTQIIILGYCGIRNCPTITGGHGAHYLAIDTGALFSGVSWAYNAGANLTVGYLILDANDEQLIIGFDLPDLLQVDGIQANFTIEVEMDTVNATDKFDYGIYNSDGIKLEEGTDQPIGTAAKDWIMLGSGQGDHLTKGDSLIFFLGNFETNVGGNTTVNLYRIRITYQIAVESI